MAQIRDLSRNSWSAVLDDPRGRTRIAARVVGAVARLAAESVPHVPLALGGRVATPADPAEIAGRRSETTSDIGVVGAHVVVDVQIVVDLGVPLRQVAERVRKRIADHIATQTGLTTTEVNVSVVDVRPGPPRGRRPPEPGARKSASRWAVAAVPRALGVALAPLRTWDRRYGVGPSGHVDRTGGAPRW